MLKREDIVEGMYIVTTEDNIFCSKDNVQNFPANSIFKVKNLTKDITNPDLYLHDENNKVWIERNFNRILSIINKNADANDIDKALHYHKKNEIEILKEIKKLAEKDDLKSIIKLLDENSPFLNTLKNVKVLMAYAIKSQKTEVLKHGFENNWFKCINWNGNIITVDYSGLTPLGYAIKKSNEDVQELLMLNGANIDNKMTAANNTTIAQSLALPDEVKTKILQISKTTDIIKLHKKFNKNLSEKTTTIKKIKI
jgi:hypothetical protein